MKSGSICFLIIFALLASQAPAQDVWEKYRPWSLKQIIRQHEKIIEEVSDKAEVFFTFSMDPFCSRVNVTYTGETRSISEQRKELIAGWVKSRNLKSEVAELFESEMLFKEDGVEHWLPVQQPVIPYFADELKRGGEVTLLLIWIGARKEDGQVDWVFLVNEFETRKTRKNSQRDR